MTLYELVYLESYELVYVAYIYCTILCTQRQYYDHFLKMDSGNFKKKIIVRIICNLIWTVSGKFSLTILVLYYIKKFLEIFQ